MSAGDQDYRIPTGCPLSQPSMYTTTYQEEQPTLRDRFAMAALTGILSNEESDGIGMGELVSFSYKTADAMLAERDKRPEVKE